MPFEGCGSQQSPWTTRIGGPSLAFGLTGGLVFDTTHPMGATIDGVWVDDMDKHPLEVITQVGCCVGDPRPGAMVLVRGTVRARRVTANPSDRPRLVSRSPNTATAAVEVKLAIGACGLGGPVIIDADSEVVVPAGMVNIEVLAPTGWSEGSVPEGSVEAERLVVDLAVSACPCDCAYVGTGRLTEFWQQDNTGEAPVLLRPRRARQLWPYASTNAGVQAGGVVRWLGGASATSFYGAVAWQAASDGRGMFVPGSMPYALLVPGGGAGTQQMMAVWDIR